MDFCLDKYFEEPENEVPEKGPGLEYLDIYAADLARIPRLSAAEIDDFFARYKRRCDEAIRNRVIEAHLWLVPPIAKAQARKYNAIHSYIGADRMEDLIQEGNFRS